MWKEFESYVSNLMLVSKYSGSKKTETPAEKLLKIITGRAKESQLLCAAIFGYGLIALLRPVIGKEAGGCHAADLGFKHWRLDLKLSALFTSFGASEETAGHMAELINIILSRTVPHESSTFINTGKEFAAGEFASAIIEENFLSFDFRNILGINTFDDITWFNKEKFEDLVFYSTLFLLIENDSALTPLSEKTVYKPLPWQERIERIGEIYEALAKAEEESGYRLDILLNNLIVTNAGAEKKPPQKGKKKN
jgi:hypothetical protein